MLKLSKFLSGLYLTFKLLSKVLSLLFCSFLFQIDLMESCGRIACLLGSVIFYFLLLEFFFFLNHTPSLFQILSSNHLQKYELKMTLPFSIPIYTYQVAFSYAFLGTPSLSTPQFTLAFLKWSHSSPLHSSPSLKSSPHSLKMTCKPCSHIDSISSKAPSQTKSIDPLVSFLIILKVTWTSHNQTIAEANCHFKGFLLRC
jgi:hypothetical protein